MMADFGVRRETSLQLRKTIALQLPEFLLRQRWFGGKARRIDSAEIIDSIPLSTITAESFVLIVSVKYAGGIDETYAMPFVRAANAAPNSGTDSSSLRLQTSDGADPVVLTDGLTNHEFLTALLDLIQQKTNLLGERGELRAIQTTAYSTLGPSSAGDLRPRPVGAEQSNTSIIYGDRLILKFFRRIQEGINPDIEIGRFLTEKTSFTSVPLLAGVLEYRTQDGKQMAQGMLQAFVPNQGDAWSFTLDSLADFYDVVAKDADGAILPEVPAFLDGVVGPYLEAAEMLGQRTAQMHLALASETSDAAFVPEPFTMEFQGALEQSILGLTNRVFALMQDRLTGLPPDWQVTATRLAEQRQKIEGRIHAALSKPIRAMRTRIHGDYHLGQVLRTASDFVIIDFEGEPARPIAERRIKRSPLQDVAGMLRSFHYAAFAPLLGENKLQAEDVRRLSGWAESWNTWVSERFLSKYFETAGAASYLPRSLEETRTVLELHLLEKAVYELGYELNNRPTWVGIPLQGISKILSI
jgi:maltose alpha-D-glucosyltransferase/alpha-amylase